MNLCVLLSAMHLKDWKILDELNIKNDCVLINQCDDNSRVMEVSGGRRIFFLSTDDRGLSKSRNLAMEEAARHDMGDICIFCDNDCVYEKGAGDEILKAFRDDPAADIIVFFIERPERHAPVKKRPGPLGLMGAMKIFSPEIAFRLERIKSAGLLMDERFGAGAEYGMGEENIFLFDAIKKGLRVQYVPLKIAHLSETESTWFKGYTDKFFYDRGAGYRRMSAFLCPLLILQFALRKHGLYKKDNTFLNALKYMFKGSRELK